MSDDAKGYTVLAEHLAVAAAAHGWADDMEYTYPPELMTTGATIHTMQAQIALLMAKVAALETECMGLRRNVADLEHRCTCHEKGAK